MGHHLAEKMIKMVSLRQLPTSVSNPGELVAEKHRKAGHGVAALPLMERSPSPGNLAPEN
jgi:hypothetical protein